MKKKTIKKSNILDKMIKKLETSEPKPSPTTLKDVLTTIEKWANNDNSDVSFVGSFISFDDEDKSKEEDEIIAFGPKESIKIHMEVLSGMLDEEKDEFINW